MGIYINPNPSLGLSKEQWLEKYGEEVPRGQLDDFDFNGNAFPVCLVDHYGQHTAAGVAYEQNELDAFSLPHDDRPKRWFIVPKADLMPFFPEWLKAQT